MNSIFTWQLLLMDMPSNEVKFLWTLQEEKQHPRILLSHNLIMQQIWELHSSNSSATNILAIDL